LSVVRWAIVRRESHVALSCGLLLRTAESKEPLRKEREKTLEKHERKAVSAGNAVEALIGWDWRISIVSDRRGIGRD
jgi:hypothetical protein